MAVGTDSYRVLEKDEDGRPVFNPSGDYNGYVRLWRCRECEVLQEAIEENPDFWCCACSASDQTMVPVDFIDTVFPNSDRVHHDPRDFRMKYALDMFICNHFKTSSPVDDFLSLLMERQVTLEEREVAHRIISWTKSSNGMSDFQSVDRRIKAEEKRLEEARSRKFEKEWKLRELEIEKKKIEKEYSEV